jgi:hypothetical protein
MGLDRANQIDPLQQIAPSCSSILADSFEERVAHLSFGGLARYSISASSDGSPHSWISGITLQPDMRRACQNRRE